MYNGRSRSRSRSADRGRYGGRIKDFWPPPSADRRREDRDPAPRYSSPDRDTFRRRPSHSPPLGRRRSRSPPSGWRRSSRSPPPRRGSHRDRDRAYGSRSASRSRSPRRVRAQYGPESREVILEGLPKDMMEEDISIELEKYYHVKNLDDTRVIRDKQTKVSRQIGFLTFHNLNESRAFLESNHPHIYLGRVLSRDGRGTRVRIAYSRERGRAPSDVEWTCVTCALVNYGARASCVRCQAPRPETLTGVAAPRAANNGDNDAAPESEPSQFILIRGLEQSVTEELLAKGVSKLYRPAHSTTDDLSGNQKKGPKVVSTTADSNLGARDGSITRVLLVRDRKSDESWGYGFAEFATVQDAQAAVARLNSFEKFTISSKPVLVSYIHAGVFVPLTDPAPNIERFTFNPFANRSLKLMYWDENAYVRELKVSTEDLDSKASKLATQTENHSRGAKDAEKAKKRKAESAGGAGSKKLAMPSHLQFWSDRHAELHGIQKRDGVEQSGGEVPPRIGSQEGCDSPSDATGPSEVSYGDLNRNCCWLCMRQFQSSAKVNFHERLSKLHRDNLQNEDLKVRAMAKLIKHGIIQNTTAEYRDRAKERRQAFGSSKPSKPKAATASTEEAATPAPAPSKGAALLSKMGWSAGSGLGAQGTGVTAPIATEAYAQGVGLGAQGSKLGDAAEEASRNTRNRYDEFLEKTKQVARERYEQMDQSP